MIGLFVGALVIAGLFTFVPGRIMHAVVITIYLNEAQVKVVRAQEPTNSSLRFGIFAEMDKSLPSGNAPPIQIKSYTVTAGK